MEILLDMTHMYNLTCVVVHTPSVTSVVMEEVLRGGFILLLRLLTEDCIDLSERNFHGAPVLSSQILRAKNMTNKHRQTGSRKYRAVKSPGCMARVLQPRASIVSGTDGRETWKQRRSRHGIARSIEDLRELRLLVVPASVRAKCLLQDV